MDIKTFHLDSYAGKLDKAIKTALLQNGITSDKLIDIKYSTRCQDNTWYSSALIIWKE